MSFELGMNSDEAGFEQFESDFTKRSTALNAKINDLQMGVIREDRKAQVIQTCDSDIFEMNNMVKKWEIELRSLPFHVKNKLQPVIKRFRDQLESSKQDFNKAKVSVNKSKMTESEEVRTRLLAADQSLLKTDESANNSKRMIAESEQIGQEVAVRLQQQRGQLENALDDLHETDDAVDKARRTLRSMGRRVLTDKLVQGIIVLLELGIIALIIYFRYYN